MTTTIVNAIVTFLTIMAGYKILEKMNEKGWKILIPVYGRYLIYKHVWNGKALAATMACGLTTLVAIVIALTTPAYTTQCYAVMGIASAATIALNLVFVHKLAKAFGRGKGFTVGLFLAEPVFAMILGFGKSEYQPA